MGEAEIRNSSRVSDRLDSSRDNSHERSEITQHLFETIREPLLVLNTNLRVKMANGRFYRTFQVAPEDTLGRLIYDLGNGQWDIPRLRKLLEEIVPQDEAFNDFEVEHEFEHIGKRAMLLNARKVNDGQIVLLAIEDITERRRLENELKDFAHTASHDLKEPLRMITSYLGLLERETNWRDEKSAEYMRFAIDGARRMNSLIDDLLKFSTVGHQREVLPVDFNLVFENVLRDLQFSIAETRAQVTKGTLPTCPGDATEFEQLLQNLISNAIRYRGEQNPKVSVTSSKEDSQWVIKVADNGIGIAAKDQERIFRPFQRLHPKHEFPGTGLGLSTCRRIVEFHGGRIWVESAPGLGSSFIFTLPA